MVRYQEGPTENLQKLLSSIGTQIFENFTRKNIEMLYGILVWCSNTVIIIDISTLHKYQNCGWELIVNVGLAYQYARHELLRHTVQLVFMVRHNTAWSCVSLPPQVMMGDTGTVKLRAAHFLFSPLKKKRVHIYTVNLAQSKC
jgi:hypothetical protein